MKLIGFCGGNAVMKNFGMILVASAMLFAFGCDDGRDPGTDAGGIVLMDSGPMTGTDAGPMTGTDAGPMMMGSCTLPTGLTALPAGCLPRCSAATGSTFYACTTAECQSTASAADTTPGVDIGMGQELGCSECVGYQQNVCIAMSCPTEFETYITCLQGGGTCDAEIMAINACIMPNQMAISTCASPLVQSCFPAMGGGFLPDLRRRELLLTPSAETVNGDFVRLYSTLFGD